MNTYNISTLHQPLNPCFLPSTHFSFPYLQGTTMLSSVNSIKLSLFKHLRKYYICIYSLKPCCLNMTHSVALMSHGILLEIWDLNSATDLLTQNLLFNKFLSKIHKHLSLWSTASSIYVCLFSLGFVVYFLPCFLFLSFLRLLFVVVYHLLY